MDKKLSLRKNDPEISQHAKRIVGIVLKKIAEGNSQTIVMTGDANGVENELGAIGINSIMTFPVEVLDFGWLISPVYPEGRGKCVEKKYEALSCGKKDLGKRLNDILKSHSNTNNVCRSIFVNCPSVVKGQILLEIAITLKDNRGENFLVVNQEGEIIPCQFGALLSHDWDENSSEAIALINNNISFTPSAYWDTTKRCFELSLVGK